MTDATREKIDTAAMKAWQEDGRPGSLANWTLGDDDDEARYWRSIYINGAANQHPIAYREGYNEAIDSALKELAHYKDLFEYKEDYGEFNKQLEKLRKP